MPGMKRSLALLVLGMACPLGTGCTAWTKRTVTQRIEARVDRVFISVADNSRNSIAPGMTPEQVQQFKAAMVYQLSLAGVTCVPGSATVGLPKLEGTVNEYRLHRRLLESIPIVNLFSDTQGRIKSSWTVTVDGRAIGSCLIDGRTKGRLLSEGFDGLVHEIGARLGEFAKGAGDRR
jgi:hypothetical protein